MGLPDSKAMPYVMVAVAIQVTEILDITDATVRRTLRLSRKRLTQEPWEDVQNQGNEAITQALGRLVRAAGIKGLLAPSAACPGGTNLVIFPDNLLPSVDRLDIVNPDWLPPPFTEP